MKGPLAVAVVAALVMYASASPCTDMCNGACGADKAACEMTGLLGGLCNTNFNLCSMGCGAVCNCVDTCDAQCGEALTTCQASGGALEIATCPLQYADCQATCGIQCGANTVAGAVDSLAGGK